MKKLLYFSLATSFFAAQIFTINLSFFQLSLFRIAVLMAPYLLLLNALRPSFKLTIIPKEENRFSVKFMILWLLYAITSLLWVKDYALGVRSIYFISIGVLFVVLFSVFFKTKKDFLICFNIMQLMVALHNLIGWYEIITRNYRFISPENIDYYRQTERGIPISMFGNPNDFALLMVFGVFIAYICLKLNYSILTKNFSMVLIISCTVLVFVTQSRANIIGLLMAMALILILTWKNKNILTITIMIIILIISFVLKPDLYVGLISSISNAFHFEFSTIYSNSESKRLDLLRNGLNFLKSTYGFGTGAGNIEYWMEYKAIFPVGRITNIHNWWMEILVGYGVIIFFLYLLFYKKLFISMYSTFKKADDYFERAMSLGILGCMTGFIIASVSSSSNISKEWLWSFWAVVVAFQGYTSRHKSR